METKETITIITDFVRSIGIPVEFGPMPDGQEFLPGLSVKNSGLLIDPDHLKYPGDILHEAGHLAVATPEKRGKMHGILGTGNDEDIGEEMMAIAWSYAAARYLNIDPYIVFHEEGYKGGGAGIVKDFSEERFFGVSTLQWIGLTYESKNAKENNTEPYPHMIKWVRE